MIRLFLISFFAVFAVFAAISAINNYKLDVLRAALLNAGDGTAAFDTHKESN